MNKKHFLAGLLIALLLMLPATFAQNARSWVASTGSDTNSCTRTAPCASFVGALAKTNAGGEIDVVDPGIYGGVGISQSVTIDGGGMATENGVITINSGTVTLRNLSALGRPSFLDSPAINVVGGGPLRVENMYIQGYGAGIFLGGSFGGGATITDTVIEDTNYAVLVGSGSVELRNVTVINASTGIQTNGGNTAVVDSCLIANSGTALMANGGTIALTNTTVTGNSVGLAAPTSGTIISFVNNRIYGNGTNGAPTQSVYQK